MIQWFFLKKNELSARRQSKIKKFIVRVRIIAKDNCSWSELSLNCFVFSPFIFGGVVAIIDKNIYALVEFLQRFNRVAIQDSDRSSL